MPIDYSKYPKNWLSEIRPRIMKRANNICEAEGCNFKHGQEIYSLRTPNGTEWFRAFHQIDRYKIRFSEQIINGKLAFIPINLKKVKVVLTIAHLDHDEENHDVKDERLAALCQKCHLSYDQEEKLRRRKLDESTTKKQVQRQSNQK